jgi:hypothetical protein
MSSSEHTDHLAAAHAAAEEDRWWEVFWPFLVIGWGVLVGLFVLIITQSTLPN